MGCCVSTSRVVDEGAALDPMKVDLRHFDVQRTLGEVRGKGGAMHGAGVPCSYRWIKLIALSPCLILNQSGRLREGERRGEEVPAGRREVVRDEDA